MREYAVTVVWYVVAERLPPVGAMVLLHTRGWTGVGCYQPSENADEPSWRDQRSEYVEPAPKFWAHLPAPPPDRQ